jgi:predicted short-subunit dehydrogenase-like oxidoreductase (DUF2520 family)
VALRNAGFTIAEIIARDSPKSRQHAGKLAAKVGAKTVTTNSAALDAQLLWLCVPDREIHGAASALADRLMARVAANLKGASGSRVPKRAQNKLHFAFHSSGALLSRELDPLRKTGIAVASVHPLMTFVAGARPSLQGVPFAIEGDEAAKRVARQVVRMLGGESFSLPVARKAAYHAWATMTSPLLLAFLVTLEEAASAAGLKRKDARRKSLPIIRQTLENYLRLGPSKSFSGPLIRGDADTVVKHLAALEKYQGAREVYVALAKAALRGLPVKNQAELRHLLWE